MPVQKLFLSVGAMKAGTTFLFNALNQHPDLYFTPEKELHFFAQSTGLSTDLRKPLLRNKFGSFKSRSFMPGEILSSDFRRHRLSMVMHNRFSKIQDADVLREIVRWYADRYLTTPVDDAWFDRVFEGAGDRYACDFSNYHSLLDNRGWQHAKALCGDLKVLYTLRHPVERLWSHIKFHYIQAGQRQFLSSLSPLDLDEVLREGAISCHARYGDIVENLKANLSDSQLKIVAFEDFTGNYMDAARDLENFLGISHYHYKSVDTGRKANATESIAIPEDLYRRMSDAVRPQLQKLKGLGVNFPESYWS